MPTFRHLIIRSTTILASVNNPPLRVTILGLHYAPEPTGNAPYTTSLAEGLARAGHVVSVVTGYPHYPEWRIKQGYSGWSTKEHVNGVAIDRLRHYIPRNPKALNRLHMELSFGLRLLFASWRNPDIVVLVSPALFASGLALLRARLSPRRPATAIWVQDIYSRGLEETGSGSLTQSAAKVAAKIEGLIIGSADGVVAIHDRFKNFLVSSLGVAGDKVHVIRNWTHLPHSRARDRSKFRERMGWDHKDVVVLHAGNMGKKQGLENVVDAARIAELRASRVRFVLLGDGNQRSRLEAYAAGARRIDFVDPLPTDEFQDALAAADILLVNELPGVKDMAVPSKLTSYFNAGIPVIAATDQGSVTAFELRASGGGIQVDAAAPEQLVEVAEKIGEQPELGRELGARGLSFRQETLSEASAIAHYDEFMSSLARTLIR